MKKIPENKQESEGAERQQGASLLFADTVERIHCDNSKSGRHESIDFRDPPSERIDNSTKCDIIPLSGKI